MRIVLGAPPFSSTYSLRRLRPQLIGLDLASAGHVLFVVALSFGVVALLVLSAKLPVYVCNEDCNAMRMRAIRDLIALRGAAAPYMDVALVLAVFAIVATTAGTVRSPLRTRPGSSALRALGILQTCLATVIGFGQMAGFRRIVPLVEPDRAVFGYRTLGELHNEAIAGLWLFQIFGILSLLVFAASYIKGGARAVRETTMS